MKKFKEDRELFELDQIVKISDEDLTSIFQAVEKSGTVYADKITGYISNLALKIIKQKAQKMNFDLNSDVQKWRDDLKNSGENLDISENDIILESDLFYKVLTKISDKFMQAFADNWFNTDLLDCVYENSEDD